MHGRASFVDVREHGLRARSGAVRVSFVARGAGAPAQVGYAISRRVGNAVVRNRLRRRLKGALSELARAESPTLCGGFYVISPSPGAVRLPFAQLRLALEAALDKVVVRSEPSDATR